MMTLQVNLKQLMDKIDKFDDTLDIIDKIVTIISCSKSAVISLDLHLIV